MSGIPLVTDNPLRREALYAYHCSGGNNNQKFEYAKNRIKNLCPIMNDSGVEKFLRSALADYDKEGQLVLIFYHQITLHCNEISNSLVKIEELCSKLDYSVPEFVRGQEIWHWVNNLLSHAAQIYYAFSPDLKKNKDKNKEFRDYRMRALRRAAGLHGDFLKPLKDLRDAYAHHDETLDHVWKAMSDQGKSSVDFVIKGYTPESNNVISIRSYDPKTQTVKYYDRPQCKLNGLNFLLMDITMAMTHNMARPGDIGLSVIHPIL